MIYYFVPNHAEASWGIGMLYQHVDMLQRNGIDATVLHEKKRLRLRWMTSKVAVTSMKRGKFRPQPNDVLVIPEVCADKPEFRELNCRRIVFVQGSFLMLQGLREIKDYQTLGYEHALVTQPHMKVIVEEHFDLNASVVPAFVAPHFYLDAEGIRKQPRSRRIITYPKSGYQNAGFPDYDIVMRCLNRRLKKTQTSADAWSLVELKNKTHQEAAHLMKTSAFFVNVNSLEGFNVTVPEAMAGGCISICYEAFGGRDYLRQNYNAYVFQNHDAYPLLGKLLELIDHYDQLQEELFAIRRNAYETACEYTVDRTEQLLLTFFKDFIC